MPVFAQYLALVLTALAARLDAASAAKICRKSMLMVLAASDAASRQDKALSE